MPAWTGECSCAISRAEPERELEPRLDNAGWVVAFSPSGEQVAALDHGTQLTVWNLVEGAQVSAWSDIVTADYPRVEGRPFSLSCPEGGALSWSPGGETRSSRGPRAVRWACGTPAGTACTPICLPGRTPCGSEKSSSSPGVR